MFSLHTIKPGGLRDCYWHQHTLGPHRTLSRALFHTSWTFLFCASTHILRWIVYIATTHVPSGQAVLNRRKKYIFSLWLIGATFSQGVVNFVKFWTLVPAVRHGYGSRDSSTPDCSTGYAVIRPRGGGFSTVGIFTKKEKIDYSCKVIKFNFDKTKRVSSTTYWLFWILAV